MFLEFYVTNSNLQICTVKQLENYSPKHALINLNLKYIINISNEYHVVMQTRWTVLAAIRAISSATITAKWKSRKQLFKLFLKQQRLQLRSLSTLIWASLHLHWKINLDSKCSNTWKISSMFIFWVVTNIISLLQGNKLWTEYIN